MNFRGKKDEITSKKTSLDAGKITLVSTFQGYPNTPPGSKDLPGVGLPVPIEVCPHRKIRSNAVS